MTNVFGPAPSHRLEQSLKGNIYIGLPARPPAESCVRPTGEEGILRALAILGNVTHILHHGAADFDLAL